MPAQTLAALLGLAGLLGPRWSLEWHPFPRPGRQVYEQPVYVGAQRQGVLAGLLRCAGVRRAANAAETLGPTSTAAATDRLLGPDGRSSSSRPCLPAGVECALIALRQVVQGVDQFRGIHDREVGVQQS